MNNQKKYKGIIVPAVTPLTGSFDIDVKAAERIFLNFYNHGISPFILGTTGEAASLPLPVKQQYVLAAEKCKKKDTILYAGISSNVLSESLDFAAFCADHAVDAVAATLPSYYALGADEMKRYFEQLAEKSRLPVIIYNIPATTHMSIPLDVIDELSHHPNIVATKDSERSEERLMHSLERWKHREDFGHFLGWAARSAMALIGGSAGLIPSTGNLKPGIYSTMLDAIIKGDVKTAWQMQQLSDRYGDLYQSGRTLGNSLWALKVLMQQKDLCSDVVMPPLQPSGEAEKEKLVRSLQEAEETL